MANQLIQNRYGVELVVIKCGGMNAPVSSTGYSGCQGTGNYDKGRKCYRCAGWGYQSQEQYYKNKAYDAKSVATPPRVRQGV